MTKRFEEYYWLEASGKLEKYVSECGGFNLPNIYAELYFNSNKAIYYLDDGYHYEREIGGEKIKKTLFGFKDKNIKDRIIQDFSKEYEDWITKLLNKTPYFQVESTNNNESLKYTNKSEIDCSKVIVDAFISIYEDECVHALSQKLLDIFKFHIDNVKQ